MEMSGKPHTLAALPWEKSPQYPLNNRPGGPQSQSGCFGKEKNLFFLQGFELWIIQPTA
jgi:hypothetical protein